MKVRAANPDRTDAHERFIRPDRRHSQILKLKTSGGSVDESFHNFSGYLTRIIHERKLELASRIFLLASIWRRQPGLAAFLE